MAAKTGRFTEGKHKGWRWEVYEDPSSPSGWIRKIWNPTDSSNGGRPTEYFAPYDFEADLEDERVSTNKQQSKAAAQQASRQETERVKTEQYNSAQQYRDTQDTEKVRQFNVGAEETTAARKDRIAQLREAVRESARQFNQEQELNERKFGLSEREFGLDQAKFGGDLLKTGLSARGALDLVQGWGYSQGVQNAGLSPYVTAIRGGTAPAYGGGMATTGHPVPLTVGTLAAEMGAGGGGQTGTDAYGRPILPADRQAFVNSVGQRYEQGLANQPLGYFENMTKGQKEGFQSAGAWLGRDVESEDEYYRRSRPGQRSALLG